MIPYYSTAGFHVYTAYAPIKVDKSIISHIACKFIAIEVVQFAQLTVHIVYYNMNHLAICAINPYKK